MQMHSNICEEGGEIPSAAVLKGEEKAKHSLFSLFCRNRSVCSIQPDIVQNRAFSINDSASPIRIYSPLHLPGLIRNWKLVTDDLLRFHYSPFFSLLEENSQRASACALQLLDDLFARYEEHKRSTLPLLAYIALRDPDIFFFLFEECSNIEELSTAAFKQVERWWEENLSQVDALCETACKGSQVHPKDVYCAQYPKAVADFLLLPSGKIFPPFITLFREVFLPPASTSSSVENHVLENLQFIENSHCFQCLLQRMNITERKTSASILLRASFDIPLEEPLTTRDYFLAALTTLLTNMRQKRSGSCFATSLGSLLSTEKQQLFLRDLKDLLSNDGLTRVIDNKKMQFPFLVPLNDPQLQTPLRLDEQSREPLLHSPGFSKLKNNIREELIQEAINLSMAEENSGPLTARTILSHLVPLYAEQTQTDQEEAEIYITWSYLSAFQNPFLLCWESSVAEMAEAKEKGMVMQPVLHAISKPISNWLKDNNIRLSDQFVLIYKSLLKKRTRLLWDPALFTNQSSHNLIQGGFVLYDNNRFEFNRIENGESFQSFVRSIFMQTFSLCSEISEPEKAALLSYISSFEYLKEALYKFNPDCQESIESGNTPLENIPHTPWRVICGNITENVLKAYFNDEELSTRQFHAANTQELFNELTGSFQQFEQSMQYSPDRILTYVAKHAFTTLYSFPKGNSLRDVVQNRQGYLEKIERCENVFQNTPLRDRWKELLLQKIKEALPNAERQRWDRHPPSLQGSTLKEFIDSMNHYFIRNFSRHNAAVLQRYFKKNCLQFLPEELRIHFLQTVLIFADSNWEEDGENIYFCFCYDPFTASLNIFEVTENLARFSPLSSEELLQTNWVLSIIPSSRNFHACKMRI